MLACSCRMVCTRGCFVAAALCLVVGISGCDSGVEGDRFPVRGDVSYDGQPIKEGQIAFLSKEPDGRKATGVIENGTYSIAAEHGPAAGEHFVQILGYRGTGRMAPGSPYASDEQKEITEQFLPPKYSSGTALSATIEAGRENVHDFDLPSDGND